MWWTTKEEAEALADGPPYPKSAYRTLPYPPNSRNPKSGSHRERNASMSLATLLAFVPASPAEFRRFGGGASPETEKCWWSCKPYEDGCECACGDHCESGCCDGNMCKPQEDCACGLGCIIGLSVFGVCFLSCCVGGGVVVLMIRCGLTCPGITLPCQTIRRRTAAQAPNPVSGRPIDSFVVPQHPAHTMMMVTVPHGSGGGQNLRVQTPRGLEIEVTVPAGLSSGSTFQIQVPSAAEQMGAVPP